MFDYIVEELRHSSVTYIPVMYYIYSTYIIAIC